MGREKRYDPFKEKDNCKLVGRLPLPKALMAELEELRSQNMILKKKLQLANATAAKLAREAEVMRLKIESFDYDGS